MGSLIECYPGQSLFHRLDPRAKIVFLLLFTTVIFIIQHIYLAVVVLLIVIALWGVARLPLRSLGGYFKMLSGILVFLFVVQATLYPGEVILIDPIIPSSVPLIGGKGNITEEGILFGFFITTRLLTMILILPLVSMTTPIDRLTLGLVRLGLPYQLAYITTTALNQVAVLKAEAGVIMDAQRLRAFRTFEKGNPIAKMKAYPLLVTPLVIGAMHRAKLVAIAMESRGFGAKGERVYIEDIAMKPSDWVFIALTVLYCLVVLLANFLS
ncbi:MAG: energy-coupling factor transporter transmembrane protein EcfT [Dehalococcoidia bacterium]|nr:MAG: energy-coupling factor transporter transmembrane protein EcfT [Dehalococcoidia bacterium]